MGLLRTLLIILLVYYGFKILSRFLFPFMMKKFVNNVEKKFKEQQGQYQSNQQKAKVGETIIDKAPRSTQKSNDKVGEYVDFEEVEE